MKLALLAILSCCFAFACANQQAKKFIYAKRFDGMPKVSDFRLEEETLPELKDGGLYFLNSIIFQCNSIKLSLVKSISKILSTKFSI